MTNLLGRFGTTTAISAVLFISFSVSAAEDLKKSTTQPQSQAAKARAEAATDQLTDEEENKGMPLPGQGYSHSSLLLDKAKDEKAISAHLDKLKREGKIKAK